MAYQITIPPVSEPISLEEAKLHLHVDHDAEDDLISLYITAAREYLEKRMNRAFMPQTIAQYYTSFPCVIESRFSPARELTIKYIDDAEEEQTLFDSEYHADFVVEPACIFAKESWPATAANVKAVTAIFQVGYQDAASVPAQIKQAILLLVGKMYEVREDSVERLPTAVDHIINNCKVIVI